MNTPTLNLPYIIAAQSQKEVTHAESLNALDFLVQSRIISRDFITPPLNNNEGDCYLVGVGATDAWLGQDGDLAQFIGGAWQFYTPQNGWRLWIISEQSFIIYNGVSWQPVMQLNSFTVSGVPNNTTDGQLIFVTDETGGAVPAFSYNGQWLRITDRAVIA